MKWQARPFGVELGWVALCTLAGDQARPAGPGEPWSEGSPSHAAPLLQLVQSTVNSPHPPSSLTTLASELSAPFYFSLSFPFSPKSQFCVL